MYGDPKKKCCACENGHLETAKFLLSVNPSINIRVYERANLKNHFNNNTNIIFLKPKLFLHQVISSENTKILL